VFFYSCSATSQDDETRTYRPKSIQEIDFEEDSAGKQFLNYIDNKGDSLCLLKYTNFNSGSFEIVEIEKKELIDFAVILKTFTDYKISIEGHTDNQGSLEATRILSENRANTVYEFLALEDISSSRMETKGFGKTKPISSNDSAAGRKMNRRVEILVYK